MRKNIYRLILFSLLFVFSEAFAQQEDSEAKTSHVRLGFTTGYSAILGNSHYQNKFPVHGFVIGAEIGEIFKEHFEFGSYFGFNVNYKEKTNLNNPFIDAGNFEYIMNISIMPYMRYYFLGTTKAIQPYLGAGVGLAYNLDK